MTTIPFAGVVLTGGASTRFGSDKALALVDGVALAARVATALRDAGAQEVVAVGGAESELTSLGCFDRIVPDRWPGEGPLGGILTAFEATGAPAVVVLACDTPTIGSDHVRSLVDALGDADAAVAFVDDRDQPLTAVWRRATAFDPLGAAFMAGERAPRRVLPDLQVARVELDRAAVDDVDRPEDLGRYAP